MTFRDDHDAAVARADALEEDKERLEAERDKLKAERDQLKAERDELEKSSPKPKKEKPRREPETPSDAERRKKLKAWLIGGASVAAIAFVMIMSGYCGAQKQKAYKAWQQKVAARQAHKDRWQQLIRVEPCVRDIAYDAASASQWTPDKYDPRKDNMGIGYALSRLVGNCTDSAKKLAGDKQLQGPATGALRDWLAAEAALVEPIKALSAYYSNADWREDNLVGAGALWAPVTPALDRRKQALAAVRRDTLPAIREAMRALQREHGRKDEIWWRIEIGLDLWAIDDLAYDKSGIYAGRPADEHAAEGALREPVRKMLERTKQAPIEVRRQVRQLEWITNQLVSGEPLHGETPLWHLAHSDGDVLAASYHLEAPAMPPDPGPAPDRGGGD